MQCVSILMYFHCAHCLLTTVDVSAASLYFGGMLQMFNYLIFEEGKLRCINELYMGNKGNSTTLTSRCAVLSRRHKFLAALPVAIVFLITTSLNLLFTSTDESDWAFTASTIAHKPGVISRPSTLNPQSYSNLSLSQNRHKISDGELTKFHSLLDQSYLWSFAWTLFHGDKISAIKDDEIIRDIVALNARYTLASLDESILSTRNAAYDDGRLLDLGLLTKTALDNRRKLMNIIGDTQPVINQKNIISLNVTRSDYTDVNRKLESSREAFIIRDAYPLHLSLSDQRWFWESLFRPVVPPSQHQYFCNVSRSRSGNKSDIFQPLMPPRFLWSDEVGQCEGIVPATANALNTESRTEATISGIETLLPLAAKVQNGYLPVMEPHVGATSLSTPPHYTTTGGTCSPIVALDLTNSHSRDERLLVTEVFITELRSDRCQRTDTGISHKEFTAVQLPILQMFLDKSLSALSDSAKASFVHDTCTQICNELRTTASGWTCAGYRPSFLLEQDAINLFTASRSTRKADTGLNKELNEIGEGREEFDIEGKNLQRGGGEEQSIAAVSQPLVNLAATDDSFEEFRDVDGGDEELLNLRTQESGTPSQENQKVAMCEFFSVESLNFMGWINGQTSNGVVMLRTSGTAATLSNKPLPFESADSFALRRKVDSFALAMRSKNERATKSELPAVWAAGSSEHNKNRPAKEGGLFSLSHYHRLRHTIAFGVITSDKYLRSRILPMLKTWLRRWDCYLLFEDHFSHRSSEALTVLDQRTAVTRKLFNRLKERMFDRNDVEKMDSSDLNNFLTIPVRTQPIDGDPRTRYVPNFMAGERADVASALGIISPRQRQLREITWAVLNDNFGFGNETLWMGTEIDLRPSAVSPSSEWVYFELQKRRTEYLLTVNDTTPKNTVTFENVHNDEYVGRLAVPGTSLQMRETQLRPKSSDDCQRGRAPCTMPVGFVRPLWVAEPRPKSTVVHGKGGAWKNYPLLLLMLQADAASEQLAASSQRTRKSPHSFQRREFYVIVDDDTYFIYRNLVIFLTYFVPVIETSQKYDQYRDEKSNQRPRTIPFLTGNLQTNFSIAEHHYRIIHGGAGIFMNTETARAMAKTIVNDRAQNVGLDRVEIGLPSVLKQVTPNAAVDQRFSTLHINNSLRSIYGADIINDNDTRLFFQLELEKSMASLPNTNTAKSWNRLHFNLSAGICSHPRHQATHIYGDVWLGICATRVAQIEPIGNSLFVASTPFTSYWLKNKQRDQGAKFPLSFHNFRNEGMFWEMYSKEIAFERQLISFAEGRSFLCFGEEEDTQKESFHRNSNSTPKGQTPKRSFRNRFPSAPMTSADPLGMWHSAQLSCRPKGDVAFDVAIAKAYHQSQLSKIFPSNYEEHLPSRYVAHIPFPWSRARHFKRTPKDTLGYLFRQFQLHNAKVGIVMAPQEERQAFVRKIRRQLGSKKIKAD